MSYYKKGDNNNNNLNDSNDRALEFKQHGEFFIKFFEYRVITTELLSQCKIKINETPKLYIAMFNLVNWCGSQIEKVTDLQNLKKKLKKVESLLISNKKKAYNELELLYDEVSTYLTTAELLPKVTVVEKDKEMSSLDDKTRAALEAWKIVYSQR